MNIYNEENISLKQILINQIDILKNNNSKWRDIKIEIIDYKDPTLVQFNSSDFIIVGKGVGHTTLHCDFKHGSYSSLKKISIIKVYNDITDEDIKDKVLKTFEPLFHDGFIKVKINNNLLITSIRYREKNDITKDICDLLLEGLIAVTLKEDILEYANSKGVLLEITPYNRKISKISKEEFELKYYKYIIYPHDVYCYKHSLYEIKKQIDNLLNESMYISHNNYIKPKDFEEDKRVESVIELLRKNELSNAKERIWTM